MNLKGETRLQPRFKIWQNDRQIGRREPRGDDQCISRLFNFVKERKQCRFPLGKSRDSVEIIKANYL